MYQAALLLTMIIHEFLRNHVWIYMSRVSCTHVGRSVEPFNCWTLINHIVAELFVSATSSDIYQMGTTMASWIIPELSRTRVGWAAPNGYCWEFYRVWLGQLAYKREQGILLFGTWTIVSTMLWLQSFRRSIKFQTSQHMVQPGSIAGAPTHWPSDCCQASIGLWEVSKAYGRRLFIVGWLMAIYIWLHMDVYGWYIAHILFG